jgi:hypothetical protein
MISLILYKILFVNPKYKPMITKQTEKTEPEYTTNITPNIQGKGLNELIEKVKDMKVKELNEKRKLNSNDKISFN